MNMESLNKGFLRSFSREYDKEGRQEAADTIRKVRRVYFDRVKVIDNDIQEVKKQVEDKKISAEQVSERILSLESEIARYEATLLNKMFVALSAFLRKVDAKRPLVSELEQQKEKESKDLEALLASQLELEQGIVAIEDQKLNRQELDKAKEELKGFYKGQQDSWEKFYEEEKQTRDVSRVMNEHNVFFVHGILPDYVPGGNSIIEAGTDWKTKLKILLALEPTLSTSTVNSNTRASGYWSWVGVVLKGGFVLDAKARDGATRAISISERTGSKGFRERGKNIISRAIHTREGTDYNEFVVAEPKVAGFYINYDKAKEVQRDRLSNTRAGDIDQMCKEAELPLFVITNGEFYRGHFDSEKNMIVKADDEALKPQFFLTQESPAGSRDHFLDDVMEAAPFNIGTKERGFIGSRNDGRLLYLNLLITSHPERFSGPEVTYDHQIHNWIDGLKPGTTMEHLATIPQIGRTIRYYRIGGKIIRQIEGGVKQFGGGKEVHNDDMSYRDVIDRTHVWAGGMNFTASKTMHTPQDYLVVMENKCAYVKEEIEKEQQVFERTQNPGNKRSAEFWREWLSTLTFHLYGFADQAGEYGDIEIKEAAYALAQAVVPKDEYQDVVKRRVTDSSPFKLTKKDLQEMGANL